MSRGGAERVCGFGVLLLAGLFSVRSRPGQEGCGRVKQTHGAQVLEVALAEACRSRPVALGPVWGPTSFPRSSGSWLLRGRAALGSSKGGWSPRASEEACSGMPPSQSRALRLPLGEPPGLASLSGACGGLYVQLACTEAALGLCQALGRVRVFRGSVLQRSSFFQRSSASAGPPVLHCLQRSIPQSWGAQGPRVPLTGVGQVC